MLDVHRSPFAAAPRVAARPLRRLDPAPRSPYPARRAPATRVTLRRGDAERVREQVAGAPRSRVRVLLAQRLAPSSSPRGARRSRCARLRARRGAARRADGGPAAGVSASVAHAPNRSGCLAGQSSARRVSSSALASSSSIVEALEGSPGAAGASRSVPPAGWRRSPRTRSRSALRLVDDLAGLEPGLLEGHLVLAARSRCACSLRPAPPTSSCRGAAARARGSAASSASSRSTWSSRSALPRQASS